MSKKPPSPSARMLLEKIYKEEKQGVVPGKLADAMHALNEQMGLSEPRTILVQNLDPREVTNDWIAPGEYGVTNQRNWSKYFKRVNVADGEPVKRAKGSAKEAKGG